MNFLLLSLLSLLSLSSAAPTKDTPMQTNLRYVKFLHGIDNPTAKFSEWKVIEESICKNPHEEHIFGVYTNQACCHLYSTKDCAGSPLINNLRPVITVDDGSLIWLQQVKKENFGSLRCWKSGNENCIPPESNAEKGK
ncbi:hypothetical protein FPQ18DRAFT_300709 [Pyronema domesticum]|nr:hypothetical protein FPQ18DRAFT_300709 [Pyronema domesticum]